MKQSVLAAGGAPESQASCCHSGHRCAWNKIQTSCWGLQSPHVIRTLLTLTSPGHPTSHHQAPAHLKASVLLVPLPGMPFQPIFLWLGSVLVHMGCHNKI